MPQLGHALIGLGVGAATERDVRSPGLRDAWPGLCVVLAYGPDLVEWVLVWTPLPVIHGATASLLALAAATIGIVLAIRVLGRESWWLAAVAGAVWVSHGLADALAGGVPLFWPWSHETLGRDYLELDVGTWSERVLAEVRWLSAPLTAGLLIAAWRRGATGRIRGLALLAAGLGVVGVAAGWWAAAVAGSLLAAVAAALACGRPRWGWTWKNAVVLAPIWLMAAGLAYGWHFGREADRRYRAGDFRGALASYVEAARFRPVDGTARSMYMAALCHRRLGELATSHELYLACLARFPECITAMYGLGLLYLNSSDPEYRRPADAAALFERVRAGTASAKQRDYLERLILEARAAAAN